MCVCGQGKRERKKIENIEKKEMNTWQNLINKQSGITDRSMVAAQ